MSENDTKKKSISVAGLILIIFGTLYFLGSFMPFLIMKAGNSLYLPTQAKVTDVYTLDGKQNVRVCFLVEGNLYEGLLNDLTANVQENDDIQIYYNELNPRDVVYEIAQGELWIFYLFFGLSAVIIGAGFKIMFYHRKKERELNKIRENGHRISVVIVSIKVKKYVRVNGKYPVNIECADSIGNKYKTKIYTSYVDLYKCGDQVNVYLDNENTCKYAFDL